MASGLDGGAGAHARQHVAGDTRLDTASVTILPPKMGVLNVTRMDLWGKKVDHVMKRNAKQKNQVMENTLFQVQ